MTTQSLADAVAESARALACIRCGYDLRGHDEAGRCPECGLKAY